MNKQRVAFFISYNDNDWFEGHVRNLFTNIWEISFFNDTSNAPIFNKLEKFHQISLDNDFDFCFFSLAPIAFASVQKWLTALEKMSKLKSAIIFRSGTIKGLDATYPPKMPFIDPSLIIFIPKNYTGKKRADYFAHFRTWDSLYFDLYAYIENYFTTDNFNFYDSEEILLNKFGKNDGFSIDKFYYSPLTGLVAYPFNSDKKLINVRDLLISGSNQKVFLKKSIIFDIYEKLKKSFLSIMRKHELVKKYDI